MIIIALLLIGFKLLLICCATIYQQVLTTYE